MNSELKDKEEEYKELIQETMDSVVKVTEESKAWKEKAARYKELAARGHRVGEKRASMCIAPPNEALLQTQQQLERERAIKAELKEKIQILEDNFRKAEANFGKKFEEEERRWLTQSTDRENEFHAKIAHLEEKILKDKENRIKVRILTLSLNLDCIQCLFYF